MDGGLFTPIIFMLSPTTIDCLPKLDTVLHYSCRCNALYILRFYVVLIESF